LDDAENDLQKMDIGACRKIARKRDDWKLILKETKVLHGPYRLWRRRRSRKMRRRRRNRRDFELLLQVKRSLVQMGNRLP
jgi:hypothetical protein